MSNDKTSQEVKNLILRDHLAVDRTILANERTLLSYIRTSLTFFVAGVTFIQFFKSPILEIVGYIFIPIASIVLYMGLTRFKKSNKVIHSEKKP